MLAMKKRRVPARAQVRYLVLWWQAQVPYAAVFDDEVAAHAVKQVRLTCHASSHDDALW